MSLRWGAILCNGAVRKKYAFLKLIVFFKSQALCSGPFNIYIFCIFSCLSLFKSVLQYLVYTIETMINIRILPKFFKEAYKTVWHHKIRVADLRVTNVYSGSEFFHPGSRVKKIPDPGSGFAAQTKKISKLLKIWSGMFIPDPDLDFFTYPGSQIQGSKKHRIPDPQHRTKYLPYILYTGCGR